MSDEGGEHLLNVSGDDQSQHHGGIASWDELRKRTKRESGLSNDHRDSDLHDHDRWSEYSHPMGRMEKDGQFLIPCEFYQRMPRWKKGCCVTLVVVLIGILVMIPVTFAVIIPDMINDAVKHSTTVLVRAVMSDPNADTNTVRMKTTLQLNNAGGVSATIGAFRVQIYAAEGVDFGEVDIPQITVDANTPANISIDDTMLVTNATYFAKATARVLVGPCDADDNTGCSWHVKGRPKVTIHLLGIPLSYHADFKGEIPLPLTQLAEAQASETELISGNETHLIAEATTTFFSQSLLELHNLGSMVFEIKLPRTGVPGAGVVLGRAYLENFHVYRGYNKFERVRTILQKTADNTDLIDDLLSEISKGNDYPVMLSGPVAGSPLFLRGTVDQALVMKGVNPLRAAPIRHSLITVREAQGYAMGGGACSLVANSDCVRGSVDLLNNPMKFANITFRDLKLHVFLKDKIEYTFQHNLLQKDAINCSTSEFVKQYTRPGMYVDDPSREDILLVPNETANVFTPAGPFTKTPESEKCTFLGVGSPYSCCFTSRQVASACRAKKQGKWSFDTYMNGTVTLIVGNFTAALKVSQPSISVYFENDFLYNFEPILGKGLITCDNIKGINW